MSQTHFKAITSATGAFVLRLLTHFADLKVGPAEFITSYTHCLDEHVKRTAESQRVLQAAREKARRKNIYDSAQTRHDLGHLARLFEAEFKKPAYEWQINVSEAIVLELEAVVIAGTGAE
ncbi:hypothetical protein GGX14DRAFT_563175 [Mycena pura]|uniref:Uncharacterized protein n=1 Tax=Mycena pura TaxID=153505 RepID=A0AAD6VIZ8_9AGAR|nr:hypothetical protein GGX14DRAFT_563175 [Mycena pura]